MANDETSDKKSSSAPSPPSSIEERLAELERMLAVALPSVERVTAKLPSLIEGHEKLWDRQSHLIRLSASRADETLQLVGAVNNLAQAKDRNTEAVLMAARTVTEVRTDLEYIRAGVDGLHRALSVKKLVRQSIREVTDKFPLLSASEAREPEGKAGVVARVYGKFASSRPLTQVLTVLLALVALAAFLGWVFYKVHAGADHAPVEAPAAERRLVAPHPG